MGQGGSPIRLMAIERIFCFGAIYGFIAASIFGIISIRVRENRTRMGQKNRHLDSFPDSMQPTTTPAQVVRGSQLATLGFIFWFVVLVIVSIAILRIAVLIMDYIA